MSIFDEIVPRSGSGCFKWDSQGYGPDVIPLWVADMDFKAAPCIREALQKRLDHGVFGYCHVDEGWYDAMISWYRTRYGLELSREGFLYTTGVVPALSAAVEAFTTEDIVPGMKPRSRKVVIQSPVYNCFFSSVRNYGCTLVDSPLRRVDLGASRFSYEMDFEDLEAKLQDAALLIICNPHNPAARVWTAEELRKVGEIARKAGVPVVSDEIHNGIVMPGHRYTPFAAASPENAACSVTLASPSKSFNIAGLQNAFIHCDNPLWRRAIDKALNINETCDVNPMGVAAAKAAYSPEGAAWLEELNLYIHDNWEMLVSMMPPQFPVAELEGTYLAWVDIASAGCPASREVEEVLLRDFKVHINAGSMYGAEGYIRINMACPRSVLREGVRRVAAGLESLAAK